MDKQKQRAIVYALLAAIFYAVNVPASKILLQRPPVAVTVPPVMVMSPFAALE